MSSSDLNKTEQELKALDKYFTDMKERVEDWGPLAETLDRRIQDEARIQSAIKSPNFMKDQNAHMRPLDWGYVMQMPNPSNELAEVGESDIFRPIPTAGEPGSFASGREVQVRAPKDFEFTPALMDRMEGDVVNYYLEGEINA